MTNRLSGTSRRGMLSAAVAPLFLGLAGLDALFAPKARLWRRWTLNDWNAQIRIDHSLWDGFLGRYTHTGADGITRVAYGEVTAGDRAALAEYLQALRNAPVSRLARDEQRAFWVNLYNAITVSIVLDHYPVRSIRDIDISPGLFADGPWDRKVIDIESEPISLNDIEHRILRPIWQDPRLHYAVNCASLGCPNLQSAAFTAASTEALLEAGARAYVNHPRGARIDNGKLVVSSIYVWFQTDFGGSDTGVIDHIRRYAEPDLANRLAKVTRIADHTYDWRLNDAA
jgi:Protein of unknown function, DUF547